MYIWVEKLREVLQQQDEDEANGKQNRQREKEDGNVSQQEKNPISDKLIASVSRLDCSDSTTTNNQNTHIDSPTGTTTAPHSFPLASHHHPLSPHENKTLAGCKIPIITTGTPLTDRKSTFQAHLCSIHEVVQVR